MLAYLFVLIAIATRIMPHPWHFTPLGAALLYFGATMPRKQWWIPLALLTVTDVLTKFAYSYPIGPDLLASVLGYALALWIGSLLCKELKPGRIAAASLVSAISFFLISNFGVWAVWNMYPKTFAGLVQCYVAAVPFARNFIADPFFTAIFFGLGALLSVRAHKRSAVAAN